METNCVRCGRQVKAEENYIKAHLCASTAFFHWACFIALMKSHGENGAEQATWQGSRVGAEPPVAADRKVETGK